MAMMRLTRKNPDGVTYRVPMFQGESLRIEIQQSMATAFGTVVDLLGEYEELGSPAEIRRRLGIKRA